MNIYYLFVFLLYQLLSKNESNQINLFREAIRKKNYLYCEIVPITYGNPNPTIETVSERLDSEYL